MEEIEKKIKDNQKLALIVAVILSVLSFLLLVLYKQILLAWGIEIASCLVVIILVLAIAVNVFFQKRNKSLIEKREDCARSLIKENEKSKLILDLVNELDKGTVEPFIKENYEGFKLSRIFSNYYLEQSSITIQGKCKKILIMIFIEKDKTSIIFNTSEKIIKNTEAKDAFSLLLMINKEIVKIAA